MTGCAHDVEPIEAAMPLMSSASGSWHQPVMPSEVLHYLALRPGATIVDATTGTGGHSHLIMPRVLPSGRLIALDQDAASLRVAQQRLAEFAPLVTFVHDNFRHLPDAVHGAGLQQVDGVLLDLGMSSPQLDEPARGFSFSKEGPLDMRMDQRQDRSAADIINDASADELTHLLVTYGEERFAPRIARRIAEARRAHPITTTTELARVILDAVPPGARHGRIHPATRTFQALRIAVNDELGALEECLQSLAGVVAPGGRVVVLTYHSLEDRMVKRAFAEAARAGVWKILTKHVVRASDEETARNPRARSAKLRAVERC